MENSGIALSLLVGAAGLMGLYDRNPRPFLNRVVCGLAVLVPVGLAYFPQKSSPPIKPTQTCSAQGLHLNPVRPALYCLPKSVKKAPPLL